MKKHINLVDLYEEFREPLKGFIGKRISDDAWAEDILHDVFLKIHNQIGSLKQKEKVAPWIYAIARNSVTDFYRKKRMTADIPHDFSTEQQSATIESETLAPMVRSMIGRLPPKYKEALVLSDFDGLKLIEVAKRLGISLPGAKSRVQRARRMLKELLLECCHFDFDRYGTVFDYYPRNCTVCCDSPGSNSGCRQTGQQN